MALVVQPPSGYRGAPFYTANQEKTRPTTTILGPYKAIRPIRQLIEGVSFEISLFHEKCLQMNQKKKLTKKIFRIPDPDF